jgi:hypothetical protein
MHGTTSFPFSIHLIILQNKYSSRILFLENKVIEDLIESYVILMVNLIPKLIITSLN